jgi:cytochrome P450
MSADVSDGTTHPIGVLPLDPKTGRAPSGPRGHRVLGMVPELRRDGLNTVVKAWRDYGDVVDIRIFGPRHAYLLAHPDHVRHVLQDHLQNYPKHPIAYGALKDTLGNGVLTAEGSYWLRQRRLMLPALHRQRIASLGGRMVT